MLAAASARLRALCGNSRTIAGDWAKTRPPPPRVCGSR
jgi:hypothetical protein